MTPEEEDALDRQLFDIFGKKLSLAHQEVSFNDSDALRQILAGLDNLYALLSHRLMGEGTK